MSTSEAASTDTEAEAPQGPTVTGGISKKALVTIAIVTAVVWAFTLSTGSTVLMIIVGVLTALVAGVLIWALRMVSRQRGVVQLLQSATSSPEARRDALAKLAERKDAGSPTNIFARAQILAADDPKEAIKLLEPLELKAFPPQMQDDVSLMKCQLYLAFGRKDDARKAADSMNLDNPARKDVRAYAASIVGEAWARTGKSKEAIALLDTIEPPKQNGDQIMLQVKVARVFARFAAGQRDRARTELNALADEDVNHLSRFLAPQFRVHPELQKLARQVLERHPSARRVVKTQARR